MDKATPLVEHSEMFKESSLQGSDMSSFCKFSFTPQPTEYVTCRKKGHVLQFNLDERIQSYPVHVLSPLNILKHSYYRGAYVESFFSIYMCQ